MTMTQPRTANGYDLDMVDAAARDKETARHAMVLGGKCGCGNTYPTHRGAVLHSRAAQRKARDAYYDALLAAKVGG
jgi:hypothetical protein